MNPYPLSRPDPSHAAVSEPHSGFKYLRVGGTPEQMGEQQGETLRDEIRGMLDALNHHVLHGQPGIYGVGLRAAASALEGMMRRNVGQPYQREMRALARAANVPAREIFLLNCIDDVLANLFQLGELFGRLGCSVFAASPPQTENSDLICGRNLDYFVPSAAGEDTWAATNYMKQHVVAVEYAPEDAHPFISIGWPGFIGVATGMNTAGLCVASLTVSTRRNWPWATPATFIYRSILEANDSLDGAITHLRHSRRTQGNNVLVGSLHDSTARIIEFTPWDFAVRAPTDGWICATNHFVSPGMIRRNSHGVVFSSAERMERMTELCTPGRFDQPLTAGAVLTDQQLRVPQANEYCGILNPCTIYSVVFAPQRNEAWLRLADRPDREFEAIRL